MKLQCRWCPMQKNGIMQLVEHERSAHPKEYWTNRAERAEGAATRQLDLAKMFRERAVLPVNKAYDKSV